MNLDDFDYKLPADLIAESPPARRSDARLLVVDRSSDETFDRSFLDLTDYFTQGDLLVLNDTRVIPALLSLRKQNGIEVELLLERLLSNEEILAQVSKSRRIRIGDPLYLTSESPEISITVSARQGDFMILRIEGISTRALFDNYGQIPLPPYIRKRRIEGEKEINQEEDFKRYQTIYAKESGSVAAPTAGFHFTYELLDKLKRLGVLILSQTLHIGSGTYQPVRSEKIENHEMHSERFTISKETASLINSQKRAGKKIFAVGTSTARALESATENGKVREFQGETDLFIYPGYEFTMVDHLITNFHLPRSTLLMLVSAFYDRNKILELYEEAVKKRYRFYSYGDAMLLL